MFCACLRRSCILMLSGGLSCMSVRSICSIVLFKTTLSLLILSLDNLSTVNSGELKSTAIIVFLFISPFSFVSISVLISLLFTASIKGCIYQSTNQVFHLHVITHYLKLIFLHNCFLYFYGCSIFLYLLGNIKQKFSIIASCFLAYVCLRKKRE